MTKILTDAGVGTLWARVKEKVADVTDEPISDDIINAICDGAQPPDDGDTSGTLYVGHVWKGTREQFYALAKTDDFTKYYVALDDAGVAAGEWIGIYDGACLPLLNKPCLEVGKVRFDMASANDTMPILGQNIPVDKNGLCRVPRTLFRGVTDLSNFNRDRYIFSFIDVSCLDTHNVTNMSGLFYGLYTDYFDSHNLDTSNVTNMSHMFTDSRIKRAYLEFDTSKVTDMSSMFLSCERWENIDEFVRWWDTSSLQDASGMFANCDALTSLVLTSWRLPNIIDMSSMFAGCKNLEEIYMPSREIRPTKVSEMFCGCKKLEIIELDGNGFFNFSQVTSVAGMFMECHSLRIVSSYHYIDMQRVTSNEGTTDMFYECGALTDLPSFRNISTSIDVHWSPLTAESAMEIINGLMTVTEARTVTFSETTYALLTESQIAQATSKGWTVEHRSA